MSDLLTLNPAEFDRAPLGWRGLANAGKLREAVNLIDAYVAQSAGLIQAQWEGRAEGAEALPPEIFSWHKGQLLAEMGEGEYARAVAEFEKSRMGDGREDWEAYVDGSIAFLQNNRSGVQSALANMEAIAAKEGKCYNIDIVRNFLQALDEGNHSYHYAYNLPR